MTAVSKQGVKIRLRMPNFLAPSMWQIFVYMFFRCLSALSCFVFCYFYRPIETKTNLLILVKLRQMRRYVAEFSFIREKKVIKNCQLGKTAHSSVS